MTDLRRATAWSGIVLLVMALGACTHRTPVAGSTPPPPPPGTAAPPQT
ncbi:MAG: hypothetical protein QOG36_829, partial [Actinomycetota bacterium]|nr:hypothetical protein [Actinomycetota bacterium]